MTYSLRKILLPILCGLTSACQAQEGVVAVNEPQNWYGFENKYSDTISNASALNVFFENLYLQKLNNNQQINVLHIGDSHIQADFLTAEVRKNLQNTFGNSGRGLLVPLKVGGTNEPSSYHTSSINNWQSKRCVQTHNPLPIGIGGFCVYSNELNAELSFKTINTNGLDGGFRQVKLFFLKNTNSYDLALIDSSGSTIEVVETQVPSEFPNTSTVFLPEKVHRISVRTTFKDETQKDCVFFGASVDNNEPGILYHSIGVNGAQAVHYAQAQYFAEQTAALTPNLLILAIGTNEAFDPHLNADSFYAQLSLLHSQLVKNNPNVPFLFITPSGSFINKNKNNPKLAEVVATIRRFSYNYNIALWDMYNITGEGLSASNFKNSGLLRPDGVHYSALGYKHQGQLFTFALLNAYNAYVAHKLP